MKKNKIYLDTSILNFYFADDSPDKMAITRDFFDVLKSGIFESYISVVVIKEIERAIEPQKKILTSLILEYNLKLLYLNIEIEELAQKYIDSGIIPNAYRDDALHIAITTFYGLDYILSWNFKHIVKLKTKSGIKAVNILNGYKDIEIITPQEVI